MKLVTTPSTTHTLCQRIEYDVTAEVLCFRAKHLRSNEKIAPGAGHRHQTLKCAAIFMLFSCSRSSRFLALSFRAGTPAYTKNSSQSALTKLKAPTATPRPKLTPGRITLPDPTITCSPIKTSALVTFVNSVGTIGLVINLPL